MDSLNDDQTAPTGSQTDSPTVSDVFPAHEQQTETVSELLDSSERFLNTHSEGLKCLLHSDRRSRGFSLEDEINEEPESEALPLFPQLCHDFPTQSVPTDVKQEPGFFLVKDAGSSSGDLTRSFPTKHASFTGSLPTQSDASDSDTIVGPVADLYIYEGDTHDFILSRTAGPSEPEHQPGADSCPHVLMCDPEATQCHLGFGEAQALQTVSQMSQHQELQPPAADAWEVDVVSVSDVRLDGDVSQSSSPVELWVDACQYLTGEDEEEQTVLDAADGSVMQGHQKSGYSPDESKELGCSSDVIRGWGPPVERWSSVDSWASALSDWTGIIEDPSEDIAAAFAEIGAEIDALTQSLDELNAKTELEEDLKTTVQEIMGVQDQPLKTKTIPDQRRLSLCPEAAGPLNVGRSRGVESVYDNTKGDQKLPPMGSLGVAVVSSGGHTEDVSLRRASSCDGDFEEDVCTNSEDYPVTLKITEDMDLTPHSELLVEETFGDGLCQVTDDLSHRSSTDLLGTHRSSDSDLRTDESFSTFPDLLEERQVGSPDCIMCLAPLRIDSSVVCQTNSCLEGDQTQNTSDHVQHRPPHPAPDGITEQPFLERDEELIQKKQKTINTGEESSPDGLKEENAEKKHFLVDLSGDLANYPLFSTDYLVVSETNPVAYITLDLNDPFIPWAANPFFTEPEELKMPHKTSKNAAESKTRSKKDKSGHHHVAQAKKQDSHHVFMQESCKQQESHPTTGEHHTTEDHEAGAEVKENQMVNEAGVGVTEKGVSKPHGKKKKKHAATGKTEGEPPVDTGGGAKPKSTKGRVDMFEAKLGTKTGKDQSAGAEKKSKQPEDKTPQSEKPHTDHKDHSKVSANDDSVKRRRVSGDKFGKILGSLESKLPKTDGSIKAKEEESQGSAARKKAYSDVVKEKVPPKEEPEVVQVIQAASVSEDPQSLRLWCQFAAVRPDYTVTWSKEGLVLIQIKRSAGDDSRVSLTITNASHKDLGRYECRLSCAHGSTSLDYLLTYEVLSEIVIPASPKAVTSPAVEVSSEEEDAHYSKLHFKEDFLSDQYFGENLPISIVTEKVHFGEGMHRRAFRTKLKEGQVPLLVPGHCCVLKVHNAISYGTKNNDELIQRNFTLAVEECQVQNTAREYIKAYTLAAQTSEAFGDIPEIIPIYLVHRPSNDIPYATLEEELIGDFVKYSVKDGKEINLMRRDSEAGQKCCAFQHWVYQNTEGNLLVTDMQGVGMKLTDVGIATCKKGYKGFKGNCATSFIDQFKALHQCNRFCEILGLRSLQPKAKKTSAAPKPKAQLAAVPKKKTFGPTVKGKS